MKHVDNSVQIRFFQENFYTLFSYWLCEVTASRMESLLFLQLGF